MSRLEGLIAVDILKGTLTEKTGHVSAQFLRGAYDALAIYREWGLKSDVDLSGFTPVKHTPNPNKKVGAFFTLGVDSFFTLLSHVEEIDDLIYVKGFEQRIRQPRLMEDILKNIQAIGRYFGKNVVFWVSDIRRDLDKYVDWYTFGHGPALASVSLQHEDQYKKIYIPATIRLEDKYERCASHPAIDPLWSTEALSIIHDGPVSRPDKLREIGKTRIALDMLRVCFQGTAYNCCECPKCIRTMISLNLLGLHSSAFHSRPPLEYINRIAKKELSNGRRKLWAQNINEAEKLLKALRGQL